MPLFNSIERLKLSARTAKKHDRKLYFAYLNSEYKIDLSTETKITGAWNEIWNYKTDTFNAADHYGYVAENADGSFSAVVVSDYKDRRVYGKWSDLKDGSNSARDEAIAKAVDSLETEVGWVKHLDDNPLIKLRYLIETHDLHFASSDDHKVWVAGTEALARINNLKESLGESAKAVLAESKMGSKYGSFTSTDRKDYGYGNGDSE